MKKILIFIILILGLTSSTIKAAFNEEIIKGNATNISETYFFIDGKQINLSQSIINNIKDGDSIVYGSPEPLLIVYENNKIKYSYGDIFHFSDAADFVNGIKLERLETKKSSDISEMVNVTTYFRIMKDNEVKEFSLNPGEYTTIWNTVIAVHRAEEPGAPIKGPQHWYIYEIYTNQSEFSNAQHLDFVEPDSKQKLILGFSIFILILLILLFIIKRREIK